MAQTVKARTGGRLVAESLEALGAEVAFGVPGIHALAIWDGLRTSPIRAIGLRTELSAGFAADGYARTSGRPAPLLLSTGPGALISLAALMEAASAHVPVVAIASQIPRDLIGAGRGFLHELPDQKASFAPVVKWSARAERAEEIPLVLAEAWRRAQTPPSGPAFVEIPVDVLAGETEVAASELDASPDAPPLPDGDLLDDAARLLAAAATPVVWAGGGVLRSEAWDELQTVAARLGSPVATTYMGKGAFPEDDPLAVGTALDEPAVRELLGGGRRPARGRHRAGRGDDRPLRPGALGAVDPRRRRPAPDRRDVRSTGARGRRQGGARSTRRTAPGPAQGGRPGARRGGAAADRRAAP